MASEDVCCVYMTLKFNALDTSKCYRGIKTIKRDKCSFLFNAPGLLPSFCYYKQMKNYQEQETSLHYLANIQFNIKLLNQNSSTLFSFITARCKMSWPNSVRKLVHMESMLNFTSCCSQA